ncbi:coiled-coil domain-containing protein 181 isoform X2 [Ambystoma mexicanum]|uniref:coiled-coil domain-containing protein 181 isoform X2 n=1 Tax=Ambystoma mexicanum TaxID=8296 RepID=UPI0037E8B1DD
MDQGSKNEEAGDSEENLGYEDDFEKDLDWLIIEEQEGVADEESQDEDIEAKIDKELQDDEKHESSEVSRPHNSKLSNGEASSEEDVSEPEAYESDSGFDMPLRETDAAKLPPTDDDLNDLDEEAKRYIAEKIEMANRLLEDELPVNDQRERKLKFKDKLIDLEVPPLEFAETDRDHSNSQEDASSRLSDLRMSDELDGENLSALQDNNNDESKDGKVLVERDGKFELMSLRDIESQSFLPKINGLASENDTQSISSRTPSGNGFGNLTEKNEETLLQPHSSSFPAHREAHSYVPQPPPNPRGRPSSASHAFRGRRKSPRRVQSADMPQRNSTFSLSPQQKELREKIERQKLEQIKEVEARKREEEELKRRENETAFRSWLLKKKEQLMEEKRIREAKEMEEMNCREGNRDPDEAYQLWLRRKQIDQLREKQLEQLKKEEEEADPGHRTSERDQAFKQWLRRKRLQKRAEQQAAKEITRRMMVEARRARQLQNLLYTISETKSFRLKDHFG